MFRQKVGIPTTTNDLVIDLEEVRRRPGVEAVWADDTFAVLLLTWSALLADSPLGLKPRATINRFVTELVVDHLSVFRRYTELSDKLVNSSEDSGSCRMSLHDDFKMTPLFKEYHAWFRYGNVDCFRYIVSFLNCFKKVHYEADHLHLNAFRKWYEVEKELELLAVPDWTENLKPIIAYVLQGGVGSLFPAHGSGSVSEERVRTRTLKHLHQHYPPSLRYYAEKSGEILPTTPPPVSVCEGIAPSSRTSARLAFVPKNWKTFRSICMEPAAYQFWQQGLRLELERLISNGPLKRIVQLSDQSTNQVYARLGSFSSKWCTLDLSSASDRVSWNKVIYPLFPTGIKRHLAATRTKSVLIEGVIDLPIQKFAPMGSAVCFPTQSILYACVIAYAYICTNYNLDMWERGVLDGRDIEKLWKTSIADRLSDVEHNALLPFRAYGDDLILDEKVSSNVIRALAELGFEVNKSKSFRGSKDYRESCGEHYLQGVQVTPLYLKIPQLKGKIDVETLESLTDMVNLVGDRGYMNARRVLLRYVLHTPLAGFRKSKGINPILFTEDRDLPLSIHTASPRNPHLVMSTANDPVKGSTAKRYQRKELRSLGTRSVKSLAPLIHEPYYDEWVRTRYYQYCQQPRSVVYKAGYSGHRSEMLDFIAAAPDGAELIAADAAGSRFAWRWTPT